MLPQLLLSQEANKAMFLGGRAFPVQKRRDYELGAAGIGDVSKGNTFQIWRARIDKNHVYLGAPTVEESILLDLPKVSEISFSFDQNANPIFAYVQDGVAKLHWFDASIGKYTLTVLGSDVNTPKVTLDAKRLYQSAVSDVLVFYERLGGLYMRMQRERFNKEHHLANGLTGGIVRCGMMRNLRVGIELAQSTPTEPL